MPVCGSLQHCEPGREQPPEQFSTSRIQLFPKTGSITAIPQHNLPPHSGHLISSGDWSFVFRLNLSNCSFQQWDTALPEPAEWGLCSEQPDFLKYRKLLKQCDFSPSFHTRQKATATCLENGLLLPHRKENNNSLQQCWAMLQPPCAQED